MMRCLVVAVAALLVSCAAWAHGAAAQELSLPDGGGAVHADPPAEGATDREVAAEIDARQDRAIAGRLRATFAGVEDLRGVEVVVHTGVVRLSGIVPSTAARQLAGQLARQVESVVLVENTIELDQNPAQRLRTALNGLGNQLSALVGLLPLLAVAVAVVALFWFLGRLAMRSAWPYGGIANLFLREATRKLVRLAIVLAGVVLALEILDATTIVTALMGTAGLFGLALGLAFRDLAENAIASLLLSLRQPFMPNDLVRIADCEGHVVRLTSRATVLITLEGNHIRIPNAMVYKGVIVNYTRDPLRRFDIVAGVGVDEDLVAAPRLGVDILLETPGVLADPPPQAFIEALGDSNVTIRYMAWVDQSAADYLKVKSEAIRRVKQALDDAGIAMPVPTYAVELRRAAPRAQAKPVHATRPAEDGPADISRHNIIERQVADDRASGGADLLDPSAPSEI